MHKGIVKGVTGRKRKDTKTGYVRKNKRGRPAKNSEECGDDDKLFIWEEYLKKVHAKAVPAETFTHVKDSSGEGFAPGMKLEARDRTSPDENYWVATVVMASGPLLLLRFDGDDDRSGDFWCDARSKDLQPVGFCAASNNILVPPAAIRHKESNWVKFLMKDLNNAVKAPNHLFHKTSDEDSKYQLKPGLKLEIVDRADPLAYWVATVAEVYGLRLNLQYEGCGTDAGTIWAYFLSDNVHQLGWGVSNSLTLKPPARIVESAPEQDWSNLANSLLQLVQTSSPDQGLNEFYKKKEYVPDPHGFMPGMKLEAVHPRDPSSICVATVSQLVNERYFLVELDNLMNHSSQDKVVMCCHSTSRNIFPVGWCDLYGIQLTPPPGYHLTWPFRWDAYLKFTKSSAAPEALFDQTMPEHEFDLGLKLEAVDQMNPRVISMATVTQVVGRTVWLQLDGYHDDSVEHIYDVESHELFPCGWCSTNGHALLTPKSTIAPKAGNNRLSTLRTRNTRGRALRERSGSAHSDSDNSSGVHKAAGSRDTCAGQSGEEAARGKGKLHRDKSARGVTKVRKELRQAGTTGDKNKLKERTAARAGRTPPTIAVKGIRRTTDRTTDQGQNKASKEGETSKGADDDDNGEATETSSESEEMQLATGTSEVQRGKADNGGARVSGPKKQKLKATDSDRDKAEKARGSAEERTTPTTIDLTEDSDGEAEIGSETPSPASAPTHKTVTIYVKHSCTTGPLLDREKFQSVPAVIGPLDPSAALRSLVERIVFSAVNSKDVLQMLAEQKTKMNIARILKALANTLSSCENLFSLNRVTQCAYCDKRHAPEIGTEDHVTWEKKHISQWTVRDAVNFVHSTGYAKFAKNFKEQEVDGRALMLLSLEEIHRSLGISLGPAVIIFDEIQRLRKRPR